MVSAALDRTELDVLRAYVNTVNPAMWLNGAARGAESGAGEGIARIGAADGTARSP